MSLIKKRKVRCSCGARITNHHFKCNKCWIKRQKVRDFGLKFASSERDVE